MRVYGVAIAFCALLAPTARAVGPATTTAATTAPAVGVFGADHLTITAAGADTWDQGSLNVVQLRGPVAIELGRAKLTADAAVVWLRPPLPDGRRPVDVVLVGHTARTLDAVTRFDEQYWVPAVVAGPVRMAVAPVNRSDEQSPTYRAAAMLIRQQRPTTTSGPSIATAPMAAASDVVALPPAVPAAVASTVVAGRSIHVDRTDLHAAVSADGTIAYVGTGGVGVQYRDATGNLLQFTAASMVLFTDLKRSADAQGAGPATDHITAGYFEGDVRVFMTPSNGSKNELRVRAERIYYEFATDRAVMDDVLLHTVDARKGIPIFIRAEGIRQLSQGEYKADGVGLTTSAFATPTYGLQAAHAYIRTEDSGDPRRGEEVTYTVQDATLNAFGLPVFYVPGAAGTMTARGAIFRGIGVDFSSNQFGPGIRTKWGLFETLGQVPPKNVDADYELDYFGYRGFAGGVNATYHGGGAMEDTHEPYNAAGDLHAYFVPDDQGTDILGAARTDRQPPETFRGRVRFEHEQDFGDDLIGQVRLGWDSDSNFLPQFFFNEYQNGLPLDESFYLKHQRGSELASIGAQFQPNRVVTTADAEQANREVNHLPDLHYDRVGDSVAADRATFFSDSSATGLQFVQSEQSLKRQGFVGISPGRPAIAYTGDPGSATFRGDTRNEVDVPLHLGPVNVVPYAMARYTAYSQGPVVPDREGPVKNVPLFTRTGTDQNRLLGGVGIRATTDFWRVDDAVESDLFDLHRIRHVISPEVTLFASGQTVDQNRVYVYDPSVDALNDVQAMQVALKQRWQTKRGGPGHWRSVDFLSLDVYANLFANQPERRFLDPVGFRSVFLQSEPEYSAPRNTANADVTWRISDTTAVLGSVVHNLDYQKLSTASVGVAVTRGDRLSYFVGTRYISELNSNVATVEGSYALDHKYTLTGSESIDLAQSRNVYYAASIIRHFDNFSVGLDAHYDQSTNTEGVGISLSPNGLARGLGSSQLDRHQTE